MKPKNIKAIYCSNIYELERKINMAFEYKDTDDSGVVVIATEKTTRKILAHFSDYELGMITFDPYDYCSEYCITITEDRQLWCEPYRREHGYINLDNRIVFIDDDSNSKALEGIQNENALIYMFNL